MEGAQPGVEHPGGAKHRGDPGGQVDEGDAHQELPQEVVDRLACTDGGEVVQEGDGQGQGDQLDRVMDALFASNREQSTAQSVAKSVHDARRLRKAGNLDGALTLIADLDTATADARETRWAYAEWQDLVRRRFGQSETLVYSQGAGRAAALAPHGDGTVKVLAVLGMGWQPGKVVSARSLWGLKPLKGGGSWS